MTTPQTTFNLVTEPWIPVVKGKRHINISLHDLYAAPTRYARLDITDPLEQASLTRLLLAIMYATHHGGLSETETRQLLDSGHDPAILNYLDKWAYRFDLKDATHPFMQVPNMRPQGKPQQYGLTRLHPGLQRAVWQTVNPYQPVTPAYAARLLLVCNMYGVAGLLTGMADDPLAKLGKRHSYGIGQAGGLCLTIIQGTNLWETLLLNFAPHEGEDKPIWEYDTLQIDTEPTPDETTGCAYYYTYPTRRMRLLWDNNGMCNNAYVTYGSRPDWTHPDYEPMAFWQTETTKKATTIKPLNPAYKKSGISTPLWANWEQNFRTQTGIQCYPKSFDWAVRFTSMLNFTVTNIRYGINNACLSGIRHDFMQLNPKLLTTDTNTITTIIEKYQQAKDESKIRQYLATGQN